jgi:hypothetical protein
MIPLHSKRALLWTAKLARNNKIHLGLHVKCPIFLPDFNKISGFFHSIFKSPISNFTEIRSVGTVRNFALLFLTPVGVLEGDESSDSECCTPGERVLGNTMFRGSLGGLHGPFGCGDEGNNTPEIPLPGIEPSLFSQ